ncbi:MAG: 4'-phosphopantetheinyl transferase superfamily protein [Candidatus Omnitrophota bacterium]
MVGIDIVNIEQIKNIYQKHGRRFLQEILGTEEINSLPRRPNTRFFELLSGYIAAKEAIFKACPAQDLDWKDISISNLTTYPLICINRPSFRRKIHLSYAIDGALALSQAIVQPKNLL